MPLELACPDCALTAQPTLNWKHYEGGKHLEARCPKCNRYLKNVRQDVDAYMQATDQARAHRLQSGPP